MFQSSDELSQLNSKVISGVVPVTPLLYPKGIQIISKHTCKNKCTCLTVDVKLYVSTEHDVDDEARKGSNMNTDFKPQHSVKVPLPLC